MEIHCRRFLIQGHVQGVSYRAFARYQAQALALKGWAKNLPDGYVEVVACGTLDRLSRLYELLQEGPPQAHVTKVTMLEYLGQVEDGFLII
jgi:acylphosphatase